MPNRKTPLRECPSPVHGQAPLISHQITLEMCSGRQAKHYHKCFSCKFFGGYPAPAGLPSDEPDRRLVAQAPAPPASPSGPARRASRPLAALQAS